MDLKDGYPYSLITNGIPYNYPKLEENKKTDVVIIGSGISGALSAYYLINVGIECIVVDARTVGMGSTCASTSLLQYELDKPLCELAAITGKKQAQRAYILCSEAIDKILDITKKLSLDECERKESLYYAVNKKDIMLIEREYKIRKETGFDVSLLHAKDIKDEYGFKADAAILSSQGAYVDAYMLTHKLHQHSIKKGLQVFDRTKVNEIVYQQKSVKILTQNGYTIHAKKIINACGYEAEKFIDKKIVQLHSTYAVASEHLSSQSEIWQDKAIIWNTADPYLYMRMTQENRIIIGGRDEDFYNPIARDKMLKQKAKQLCNDFKKLFPNVDFIPEFTWTGTFGTTKDSLPFIGTYKKNPHTYFALGFGGNGITFSLIAAELISDSLKGIKNPDASIFSFDRLK
jgi:glycine/D-amino acid oxidase-like deaminating enzyme